LHADAFRTAAPHSGQTICLAPRRSYLHSGQTSRAGDFLYKTARVTHATGPLRTKRVTAKIGPNSAIHCRLTNSSTRVPTSIPIGTPMHNRAVATNASHSRRAAMLSAEVASG